MSVTILRKCLDELSKESPKLDYVRGMLETLIEMSEQTKLAVEKDIRAIPILTKDVVDQPQDEASFLEAGVKANLETIKGFNTEA